MRISMTLLVAQQILALVKEHLDKPWTEETTPYRLQLIKFENRLKRQTWLEQDRIERNDQYDH